MTAMGKQESSYGGLSVLAKHIGIFPGSQEPLDMTDSANLESDNLPSRPNSIMFCINNLD